MIIAWFEKFLTPQFFKYREVRDAEFIVSRHEIVEIMERILCAERRFVLVRTSCNFQVIVQ